jgi:hypothetical protein
MRPLVVHEARETLPESTNSRVSVVPVVTRTHTHTHTHADRESERVNGTRNDEHQVTPLSVEEETGKRGA